MDDDSWSASTMENFENTYNQLGYFGKDSENNDEDYMALTMDILNVNIFKDSASKMYCDIDQSDKSSL